MNSILVITLKPCIYLAIIHAGRPSVVFQTQYFLAARQPCYCATLKPCKTLKFAGFNDPLTQSPCSKMVDYLNYPLFVCLLPSCSPISTSYPHVLQSVTCGSQTDHVGSSTYIYTQQLPCHVHFDAPFNPLHY